MRRLTWLLWLLIALMPARGIAQSLMVGGAFGHAAAASPASAGEAPCPMHAGAGPDAGSAASDVAEADATLAVDSGAPHACNLCNVCHSAVLPLNLPVTQADTAHDAAPTPAHGLGAGRAAAAELFRPPR